MPWFGGSPKSPEDQFANEVIGLVSTVLGLKAKRVDDFVLRIERPGSTPVTMNLHNIYLETADRRRRTSSAPAPARARDDDPAPPGNGLLPRADVLMFIESADPASRLVVRWDDALRLVGDALQEEAAYDPPRWRYRGWPDSDTLALLRAKAVPLPPPARS